MTTPQQNNLYIAPSPPATNDPDLEAFYAYLPIYEQQKARLWENVLLTQNLSPLRVPDTTIDVATGEIALSTGTIAYNTFLFSLLPHMATTTSNAYQTLLSYTGKGIVLCAVGVSQDATHTSTAAGVSMRITVDGNVVFDGSLTTAVNHYAALVGQINQIDVGSTSPYYLTMDAGFGLAFNSTLKIEYKSATNGQGASAGCRVLKLH